MAGPICGALDCLECTAASESRILAGRRPPKHSGLKAPLYGAGEAPSGVIPTAPEDPYPTLDQAAWRARMRADGHSRPFSAKVPANEGVKQADLGGSGSEAGQAESAEQRAYERYKFPVSKRDGYRCQRCLVYLKYKRDRSVHHVLPRVEGGPTLPDNLILLCHGCHNWVEIQEPPLRSRAAIVGSMA